MNLTVDDAVAKFYNIIFSLISPPSDHGTKKQGQYPKWYSSYLVQLIRTKEKFFKRFKSYKTRLDYLMFSKYRARVKVEIIKCRNHYISLIETNIKHNPKSFWDYHRSLRTNSDYPSSMFLQSKTSNIQTEICQLFADHFRSVYVPVTNTYKTSYCYAVGNTYYICVCFLKVRF